MDSIARVLFGEDRFAIRPEPWMKDATCAEPRYNPNARFPARGESSAPAKAVCARCLRQSECLGWALDQGPSLLGIWGGTTQRDRKKLTTSGKVTGELVRHYGPFAMQGREVERDREFDALRWAAICEESA